MDSLLQCSTVVSESPLNHTVSHLTCFNFSLLDDLKETERVKICFPRAYFDTDVRKRAAECTYVLPQLKFLFQLSCHTVKSEKQSRNFVSCHYWIEESSDFLWEKVFISLPFFRPVPSLLPLLLQAPQSAVTFNTQCSACSLELCTHTHQAGNKDLPPPSLQSFNLKSATLSLTNKGTLDFNEVTFLFFLSVSVQRTAIVNIFLINKS